MTTDEFRQPPPFCLQVELTEGCQLRCDFCGLNGIRGRENNFKFMSVELALRLTRLMKDDCWLPRIEFAMHGEPSANPDMLAILNVFRYHLPRRAHLMMTSNGYGFVKDPTTTVDAALHCLNVLALDAYEGVRLVPRILEQPAPPPDPGGVLVRHRAGHQQGQQGDTQHTQQPRRQWGATQRPRGRQALRQAIQGDLHPVGRGRRHLLQRLVWTLRRWERLGHDPGRAVALAGHAGRPPQAVPGSARLWPLQGV
jgi:hypothetical protein